MKDNIYELVQKMYNPAVKMEYFSQFDNDEKKQQALVYRMAEYSELFESPQNKNLYEIKPKKFQNLLLLLNTVLVYDIRKDIVYINDYIQWAASKGLCNPIDDLISFIDVRNLDLSEVIRKKIFKDNNHLETFLNELYDLTDVQNIVVIVIMAWLGVEPLDVIKLLDSDVNVVNGMLRVEGKTIEIPDNLNTILAAYQKKDFISNQVDGLKRTLYKPESKYFLKYNVPEADLSKYTNKPYSINNLRYLTHTMYQKYPQNSNYLYGTDSIALSGDLYRIYINEKNNIDVMESIHNIHPQYSTVKAKDFQYVYDQYCKCFW